MIINHILWFILLLLLFIVYFGFFTSLLYNYLIHLFISSFIYFVIEYNLGMRPGIS